MLHKYTDCHRLIITQQRENISQFSANLCKKIEVIYLSKFLIHTLATLLDSLKFYIPPSL
ncbi:Uncharacterised protein [Yersinia pseudotuberculosis]|nr:Uncharacterised protein [Yersinia pseudotuberculosis]